MPAQRRSSTGRNESHSAKTEKAKIQAKAAFAELSRKVHCDEAAGHVKTGNYTKALEGYNVALELNPTDKNALVARSKCYLLLGEPELALKDAESALEGDKTFVKAIYQKAEALYHLGNFEQSLMYHHRGLRLRPELEGFRLGVQKAQEAIENTIGGKVAMPFALSMVMELQRNNMSGGSGENKSSPGSAKPVRHSATSKSTGSDNKSRPLSKTNKADRRLLGELYVDKEYLEQLLKHPDLRCLHQENTSKNQITKYAEEGIAFLKNRQEFWRQQRSNTSIVPMTESSNKRHNRKGSANGSCA